MSTVAELRTGVWDAINETSSNSDFDTTRVDNALIKALQKRITKHKTYLKTAAVVITEGLPAYERSGILPPLETGESVHEIFGDTIQYQRGEAANITAFTDLGGGAIQVTTDVDNDFTAENYIRIYNTTSYNSRYQIDSITDTKNFKINGTFVADDATGVAIEESQYRRIPLQRTSEDLSNAFYENVIKPPSVWPKEGIILIKWIVVPDTLPVSGDLSDLICPLSLQHYLSTDAASLLLRSTRDDRFRDVYQTEVQGGDEEFRRWQARNRSEGKQLFGKWVRGYYSYQPQEERALVIAPRQEW